MKVALIGLAQSGKTTVFTSVTGIGPGAGGRGHEVQLGNVKVPDARIDRLCLRDSLAAQLASRSEQSDRST